ncbi:MAG: helix-turn-helix domain-containing protein [Candidatus Limisoma sp.]
MKINRIHIGHAITNRIKLLGISKSEFARRIGIRQQHVNKLLESNSIDTEKLATISKALDFNFFSLYLNEEDRTENAGTENPENIELAAAVQTENILLAQRAHLAETITLLESRIDDKNKIIRLMEQAGRKAN